MGQSAIGYVGNPSASQIEGVSWADCLPAAKSPGLAVGRRQMKTEATSVALRLPKTLRVRELGNRL